MDKKIFILFIFFLFDLLHTANLLYYKLNSVVVLITTYVAVLQVAARHCVDEFDFVLSLVATFKTVVTRGFINATHWANKFGQL